MAVLKIPDDTEEKLPDGFKRVHYSYRVSGEMVVPDDIEADFDGLMDYFGNAVVLRKPGQITLNATPYERMRETFTVDKVENGG